LMLHKQQSQKSKTHKQLDQRLDLLRLAMMLLGLLLLDLLLLDLDRLWLHLDLELLLLLLKPLLRYMGLDLVLDHKHHNLHAYH
jgi:hypothetical protein